MVERGLVAARQHQTAYQQNVERLIIRTTADAEFGQAQGARMILDGKGVDGFLPDPRLHDAGDAFAFNQQPSGEFRTAPWLNTTEQRTSGFDVEIIVRGAQHIDVDIGRDVCLDRVATQAIRGIQRLAQRGKAPAQSAQRVGGFREQFGRKIAPVQRGAREQHTCQSCPGLIAAHRLGLAVVINDGGFTEQADFPAQRSALSSPRSKSR